MVVKARWWRLLMVAGALLPAGGFGAMAAIHADSGIDLPMYREPLLPHPKTTEIFNPAYLTLWRQTLDRPSVQTRCHVCAALVHAGRLGFPGLTEFLDTLEKYATTPSEKSVLRQGAVAALGAINDPAAAPAILRADKIGGVDVALDADVILARWHYKPAVAWWLSRVAQHGVTTPVRISAIQALVQMDDRAAITPLHHLVADGVMDIRTRLAAAAAMARLHATGLAAMAAALLAVPPRAELPSRLIAVSLVAAGRSRAQRAVLAPLAVDKNLAVQVLAVRALLKARWQDLVPHIAVLAKSPNSTVRLLAARLARRAQKIVLLCRMLNDPRRTVRWYARDALVVLGQQKALRNVVRRGLMTLLASHHPRQQQQAALALGKLHYQPAAPALLNLLPDAAHPRVRLVALVALRRLAVPATLPALLRYARKDAALSRRLASLRMHTTRASAAVFANSGKELAQMFQLFGKTHYRSADALMKRFIPKHSPYAVVARAAAIWALGKIHAGDKTSFLVGLLQGRLADQTLMDSEAPAVRRMAAISLGRLGAAASVPELQSFFSEEPADHLGLACRWAIEKLTGKLSPMPVLTSDFRDNFLAPHHAAQP